MVGIAEASAAIGSIKAALGIAKGLSSLKTETDINHAVIDIQRTLLDAQAAALDDRERMTKLLDRISVLERQISASESWEDDKARYRLTKSSGGAFTYDLVPELSNGEVSHRLCTTCYERGKKSILHTKAKHSGGEIVTCVSCQADLVLSNFEYQIKTVSRKSSWLDRY